jgi:hypothetical protein
MHICKFLRSTGRCASRARGLQKVKEATIEQVVDVGMAQSGVQGKLNTVGEARLSEKQEDLAARYKIGEAIEFTVEALKAKVFQLENELGQTRVTRVACPRAQGDVCVCGATVVAAYRAEL